MFRNSSVNSGKRAADPSICSGGGTTTTDLVMEAKRKEKIQYTLQYEKHAWSSFQKFARALAMANGLALDELKEIEREFSQPSDDSKSPLKKKHKSSSVAAASAAVARKPPPSKHQHEQQHYHHALTDEDLQRIRNLKKNDLIQELKAENISYKGHHTKAVLVETYINGLAKKYHEKQAEDLSNKVDEITLDPVVIDVDADDSFEAKDESMECDKQSSTVPDSRPAPMLAAVPQPTAVVMTSPSATIGLNKQSAALNNSGVVRRIVAEKEQQAVANGVARLPAAFPMSSAKKMPMSESKKIALASSSNMSALSPIVTDLFASKGSASTSGMDIEVIPAKPSGIMHKDVAAVAAPSEIATISTTGPSKSITTKGTAIIGSVVEVSSHFESTSKPSATIAAASDRPILPSRLDSVIVPSGSAASAIPYRSIEPLSAKWRGQATPALVGTSLAGGGHVPGSSDAFKAHMKDRNNRAAQLKEESRKAVLPTNKPPSVAEANAKAMNDRLQAMQAKHRAKLGIPQSVPKALASTTTTQQALATSDVKMLSSPSLKSKAVVQPSIPRQNAPFLSSPLLSKQNSGLAPKANRFTPPKEMEESFVNYEMTDTENYSEDDDDDDASAHRERKRVPDWAQKGNLIKALERQYSPSYQVDLDELFGEVFTCDLEEVFGRTSKRYRKRQSSGDWAAHRVTEAEKRAYRLAIR